MSYFNYQSDELRVRLLIIYGARAEHNILYLKKLLKFNKNKLTVKEELHDNNKRELMNKSYKTELAGSEFIQLLRIEK